MKIAFAAALLNAAYATTLEANAEAEWEPSYYYYPAAASVTNRDPWAYPSSWSFDFDKIDDAAEEVYFGTDSESEINDEPNDSWSSYEGYTDPNSDSSGTATDGPQHRNSSDESDCNTWDTSDCHSHSSESLHDADDSHCHDSDCNSSDDSSHSHHSHSSSDTYAPDSSHSNDSSYPYSSESDGYHQVRDFGRTVGGYHYSGYHGNGYYAPDRYYVSGW